jgi:hypothetical protein
MSEHDELTGIFDDLSPEDFVLESTAIASMQGCYAGPDVLDGFLEHQLNAVRLAFSMADGWLYTTAVLAGREGLRTFVADDDETLRDFVSRVRGEAARMRAHWCFMATQTLIGPRSEDGDTGQEAVVWQLTSTEAATAGSHGGFMTIVGNRLGESYETQLADPGVGPWADVLPAA